MEIVNLVDLEVIVKDYRERTGLSEPGQLRRLSPLDAAEFFAFEVIGRGGGAVNMIDRNGACIITTVIQEGEWRHIHTFEGHPEAMAPLVRALWCSVSGFDALLPMVPHSSSVSPRALVGARIAGMVFITGAGINDERECKRLVVLPDAELRPAVRAHLTNPKQLS